MDILELFQMKQLIVDPTCTTGNTESLIDIIATNCPDKVKESGVIEIVKTRKVRNTYAPWLTTDIRCEMNMQDYLKKKAVKNNSKSLHQAYTVKRNEVNKLIKSAKAQYCKDNIQLNKDYPKEMWKNINQVINGKGWCSKTTTITTIKDDLGDIIQDVKGLPVFYP
ncbi:Hypothetical predicted protein [Paramuricea clavata]|uniref:Uncharacterized protein n=1 Tax=Paramuricea clavata TaxID=317549 RepID=A0A6S7GDX2_PARCT|nr:Hypothetical predicted protein [Paramuricea clavata]